MRWYGTRVKLIHISWQCRILRQVYLVYIDLSTVISNHLFYHRSRWYFWVQHFWPLHSQMRSVAVSQTDPDLLCTTLLIPNLNSWRKLLPRPCDPRISEHHTTVNIMKIPAILLDMDMAMPVFLMQMLPQPRLRLELLRNLLSPLLLKLMLVSLPAPMVTVSLDMAL